MLRVIQCSSAVDVILFLDGSYSIGKGSFERSKHFAAKLCNVLDINPDRVRIGVIQFSSRPKLEFALDVYPTQEEAKEAIKRIHFRGGSTDIGRAIKHVLKKGFPGGRLNVPKIMILLTDGKSQDNIIGPARFAKNSGIAIFAVGVKHPYWKALYTLASKPSDLYVFYAEHYDDALNGLFTTLTQATVCNDVHPACKVESHHCLRTTVEAEKEYKGNHICWKGKNNGAYGKPFVTFCPFFIWKRVHSTIQSRCHRTVCPDPCDSTPCLNGGTCLTESVDDYSCLCLLGYGGDKNCAGSRYQIPVGLAECTADILFLVDGSWNMGLEGFLRAKSFVKRLVQSFFTSSAKVLIGFAQYSDHVKMEIGIGQYESTSDLLLKIDSVHYEGGNTFTGRALDYVAEYGFKANQGARMEVPHILVVLSNSKSHDSVQSSAEYAREREIFILTVGTRRLFNEMNSITGDSRQVFTFSDPQEFYSKVTELRTKICGFNFLGCYAKALELVFILDASSNVGRQNYRLIKGFVRNVISQFDIDIDLTQVGMVIYSDKPRSIFNLDTFDSEGKMKKAVTQAPFLDGNAFTGKALNYVLEDIMSAKRRIRPGVHKFAVVVTDGQSSDDASASAERLRRNGIAVLTVGVGDAQSRTLLDIAGNPKLMIPVPSYEDMKHYETNLVHTICEELKVTVNLCTPNPCMNGGICVERGGSYNCQCFGWEGAHCELRPFQQSFFMP
nr:PREDICTED: von Willebrand factor A domain-containing protein 2-like [Latimeria chalumnae]|eukprot:XP_014349269.1 PREDICTED: von Willebrand factor A domain-containing protein 2-like [Latimeria chalumnae]